MNERKYVAISIKHTEYRWKFGMPCVLWGYHRTEENEERCFSGYTEYLNRAELYSIGDFKEAGYSEKIVKEEPVEMDIGFCKKYKKYDTVLVDADDYAKYCKMCCIDTEPKTHTV